MYFCPKCEYVLDISKNELASSVGEVSTEKPANLSTIIKKILDDNDVTSELTGVTLNNLEQSSKYKKLSENNRNKVYNVISENLYLNKTPTNSGTIFNCKNCNYSKEITNTILLYNKDFTTSQKNAEYSNEDYAFIINDLTLPRTKDYICKNINCITNDKKNKNNNQKEAIFFRNTNYDVTYVCTVCTFRWTY